MILKEAQLENYWSRSFSGAGENTLPSSLSKPQGRNRPGRGPNRPYSPAWAPLPLTVSREAAGPGSPWDRPLRRDQRLAEVVGSEKS